MVGATGATGPAGPTVSVTPALSIHGVAFTAYQTTASDNITPVGPVFPTAVGQVIYASACSVGQGQIKVKVFCSLADQQAENVLEEVDIMLPATTVVSPQALLAAVTVVDPNGNIYVQDAGTVLGYLTLQSLATAEGSPYARLSGTTY